MVVTYNVTASIVLYEPNIEKLITTINSFLNSNIESIYLLLIDNSAIKNEDILSITKKHKNIGYMFNNKNIGFGAAHNIAVNRLKKQSKYHIILNPDVYFDNTIIKSLFNNLENDLTIGLASTKIYFPNGLQQFAHKQLPKPIDIILRFCSNKIPFLGSLILKLFQKRMGRYELKHLDHTKNIQCKSISGCFMFFRMSCLIHLNGFDTRFFLYFEDIDLSKRCAEKYKNIIFNNLKIVHHWERSSYKNMNAFILHLKSAYKYFNKWGWL